MPFTWTNKKNNMSFRNWHISLYTSHHVQNLSKYFTDLTSLLSSKKKTLSGVSLFCFFAKVKNLFATKSLKALLCFSVGFVYFYVVSNFISQSHCVQFLDCTSYIYRNHCLIFSVYMFIINGVFVRGGLRHFKA